MATEGKEIKIPMYIPIHIFTINIYNIDVTPYPGYVSNALHL